MTESHAPAPVGLVLAAGEGRRFGGPKAPFVIDGERLVDRAVRVLREGGCDPVVVVLGAWVEPIPGAEVVINLDWPTGMASSLTSGLHAIDLLPRTQRAVITLVDLPGLTSAAVARLIASPADISAASYQGTRGHPVMVARNHWKPLAAFVSGDEGARRYLANHDVALVEVGDVASGDDLDERREGE